MDYVKYLHAKRTVDDRAMNSLVLNTLEQHVQGALSSPRDKLRIVEVGAGIGAMVMRFLARENIFNGYEAVVYTAIDVKTEVLVSARETLREWSSRASGKPAISRDNALSSRGKTQDDIGIHSKSKCTASIAGIGGVHHVGGGHAYVSEELDSIVVGPNVIVRFVQADALEYLGDHRGKYDVVIGAAVLDLWELDVAIPVLLEALDPKSCIASFYFPINFDGVTDLWPTSSMGEEYDDSLIQNFHKAMGVGKAAGAPSPRCFTGRRIIYALEAAGAEVREAGGSTWVVMPQNGRYSGTEDVFLQCIVDFIVSTYHSVNTTLSEHQQNAVDEYYRFRLAQIRNAKLGYVAHNIDVFGTYDQEARNKRHSDNNLK